MSWTLLLPLFYGFRPQTQLPQFTEKGKWQNQNWSPGRLTSSRHLIPEQQVLTPEDCLMNSFLDAYPPVKKKKKKKSIDKRDKEEKQEEV